MQNGPKLVERGFSRCIYPSTQQAHFYEFVQNIDLQQSENICDKAIHYRITCNYKIWELSKRTTIGDWLTHDGTYTCNGAQCNYTDE